MKNTAIVIALGILAIAALGGGAVAIGTAPDRLADAIAHAEGFYAPGRTRPKRNNNPGNITDSFGFPIVGHDGMFPIFETAAGGWAALKKQVSMMFDGSSRYYKPHMSIREIAENYTKTEQDIWALNVARALGVTVDTPIAEL